ncbi:MAG: tyrosine-type recombinase/integrase [Saprospiraceae bacterium]|nr:tyrosine-type recombinase/integrase [Saprospiraceae bacterium]
MEEQEVFNVISTIKNVKHKTLIILLYSTGMRVSEITNLKLIDIDSKLMRIKIVNGKGKKRQICTLITISFGPASNVLFILQTC